MVARADRLKTSHSVTKPIRTADEYIEPLRSRKLKVYLFGELVSRSRSIIR